MKALDILVGFELELNKIDDIDKPKTDDSIFWLNQAILKFVKDRFNGNAPKRTSYEQNEKRTRDLNNLLVQTIVDVDNIDKTHVNYDSYNYKYPEDFMFVLNEDVVIADINGEHKMDTCIFECTADSFMYRINNSLTDFHYKFHRARPLRVRTNNGFSLLTDKKYIIQQYSIGYLKVPTEIANDDPEAEYNDFPDYIWPEIIKIAAQMYLENQADERYKTITNEVLTQE